MILEAAFWANFGLLPQRTHFCNLEINMMTHTGWNC